MPFRDKIHQSNFVCGRKFKSWQRGEFGSKSIGAAGTESNLTHRGPAAETGAQQPNL